MKIAFTGHRPNKLGNDYNLTSPLIDKIKLEIVRNVKPVMFADPSLQFIVGMALGIDTLAAKIAIENNIPFIAAIPFNGQQNAWPLESQKKYGGLLIKANKIIDVNTNKTLTFDDWIKEPVATYQNHLMQKRNKWMVDNCDILIAVWDGTSGGTANCVRYAMDQKCDVIRINPNNL